MPMKKKKISKSPKEKFLNLFSGVSGSLSFLGGWQVCHNLCLGIIAALSLIGITIVGMPLLFLQQYNVYFWSAAVLLLIPTFIMYWKSRKYMSSKLVLFNLGIIIAAVPFIELQNYMIFFWLFGGALLLYSILLFVKGRFMRR